ncbi:MAG: NFACT family protein [Chloroflexi bacterium]|nr:NFACT family protein [Chloroflexota bacterium]
MNFDSLIINALTNELDDLLRDARAQKIRQTSPLVFTIRWHKYGKTMYMLVSLLPQLRACVFCGRMEGTGLDAGGFVMLLRKYIENSPVLSVSSLPGEKIIRFKFPGGISLVIELAGPRCDALLVHEDRVLGSLRGRLSPHDLYSPPEAKNKINPFTAAHGDLTAACPGNDLTLEECFLKVFYGISKEHLAVVMAESGLDPEGRAGEKNLAVLIDAVGKVEDRIRNKDYRPCLCGRSFCLWPLPGFQAAGDKCYNSVSGMLEETVGLKFDEIVLKTRKEALLNTVNKKIGQAKRKLEKQNKDLAFAEKCEEYRRRADLVLAHLHLVKRGIEKITLPDLFSQDGTTVDIPLDRTKSPQENAQHYYSLYKKGKRTFDALMPYLKATEKDLAHLESLAMHIETADTIDDLEYNEAELEKPSGKKQKEGSKKKDSKQPGYRTFDFKGYRILAGKSPRANTELSMRTASPHDLWFHARGTAGAHVILRLPGEKHVVPGDVIEAAASIAAYYSKARNSGLIEVDYTRAGNLKKPPGTAPGYVTYHGEKTARVPPALPGTEKDQAMP